MCGFIVSSVPGHSLWVVHLLWLDFLPKTCISFIFPYIQPLSVLLPSIPSKATKAAWVPTVSAENSVEKLHFLQSTPTQGHSFTVRATFPLRLVVLPFQRADALQDCFFFLSSGIVFHPLYIVNTERYHLTGQYSMTKVYGFQCMNIFSRLCTDNLSNACVLKGIMAYIMDHRNAVYNYILLV